MKISLRGRMTPNEGVLLPPEGDIPVENKPQKQLQREDGPRRWWVLECGVLAGERIVVVPDKKDGKAAQAAFPGLVRYYGPEIEELARVGAAGGLGDDSMEGFEAFLRDVHRLKREFGGWVVPGSGGRVSTEAEKSEKGA